MIVTLGGVKGSGKDTVGDLMGTTDGYRKWAFAAPLKQMAKIAFPQLTHDQLWGSSSSREEALDIPMRGLDPRDGSPMTSMVLEDGSYGDGPVTRWKAKDGTLYPAHLSARIILQTLGTEWGRRLYDNIWVDAALLHCMEHGRMSDDNWVLTDQRFPNEVRVSRERGAVTVRLLRGWYETKQRFEDAGVLKDGKIVKDVLAKLNGEDFHLSELLMFTIPEHDYDYVLDNRVDLDDLPKLVKQLTDEIKHPAASWLRARNFSEEIMQRRGKPPRLSPMRIGL